MAINTPTIRCMTDAIKEKYNFSELCECWMDGVVFKHGYFVNCQGIVHFKHFMPAHGRQIVTHYFVNWVKDNTNDIKLYLMFKSELTDEELASEIGNYQHLRKLW